jgi:hypothetical protein
MQQLLKSELCESSSDVMSSLEDCIWCGKSSAESLEHIIPESLDCPSWFVLERGVCEECNSAFGTLDAALLKPFELQTFIQNIPRQEGEATNNFSTFKLQGHLQLKWATPLCDLPRARSRPVSDKTINADMRRMGYVTDAMTAHCFRAMASTLHNEVGR